MVLRFRTYVGLIVLAVSKRQAFDSELRGCDIVKTKIGDLVSGAVRNRATVIQQKTGRLVQIEKITDGRNSLIK